MTQTQQTRKFGKYNFIYGQTFNRIGMNSIILEGPNKEINTRLLNAKQKYGSTIIVLLASSPSNCLYHIKDTSVGVTYNDELYTITIWHQDANKRQETRKFLEEILN